MKFNDKITKEITFKQVELGNKGLEKEYSGTNSNDGGRTPSTPSQSLENTRTTSIKETAIQGTKILLPGSDVILLVKKPIQESPKVYQTTRPSSASRFKNRNNVSKKRVGKLSDFSRKEFENSEIIENNISQNFSKEGEIRIKAD